MAGAPAQVGDDGRRALHHRFPVRRGGAGDQHLAGLKAGQGADVVNDPHRARGDRVAHRPAGRQHRGGAGQPVFLQQVRGLLRADRLRPGLQDVEFAGQPVLGPFDVHGHGVAGAFAVMPLDLQRVVGQRQHLLVAQAEPVARGQRGRHGPGRQPAGAVGVDHLHMLAAQRAPQHGAVTVLKRRLVDVELVRADGALHDRLAQPVGRRDQHHVAEAGLRVQGEDDAGRSPVGAHHLLHADRQRHVGMVEALIDAIGNGPVGEQGGEAAPAGVQQLVDAVHV